MAFPVGASKDMLRSGTVEDGDIIGFMLRELTLDEARERRQHFGVALPVEDAYGPYYRCIYWDESTRLCGAYGDRPRMCRDYPYPLPGDPAKCEHGCSCEGAPLTWPGD